MDIDVKNFFNSNQTFREDHSCSEHFLTITFLLAVILTSAAQGQLHPFRTYPIGSRPEAVAIGDVNNDGRNDVVLTTSFYFDPDNDYSILVFLQDDSGNLKLASKRKIPWFPLTTPTSVVIGKLDTGQSSVVVGSGQGMFIFDINAGGELINSRHIKARAVQVRIADLNNDGLNDLVGSASGGQSVDVIYQLQEGGVCPACYSFLQSRLFRESP